MSGWPDHAAARWADDAGEGDVGAGAGEGAGAGAGAGERLDDEGAAILADVAAISAQRDEYLESLQRLKAEFDNYRKRVVRLQEEQAARAEANLVGKLLPVIDNLDLAWAHLGPPAAAGQSVSEEARAIAQAREQLLDALGKAGLERVDAVGVPFDPTVHDAVAHTDGGGDEAGGDEAGGADAGAGGAGVSGGAGGDVDGPAPRTMSVDEVLRAGYRWRGQVLRPAMVRVRG